MSLSESAESSGSTESVESTASELPVRVLCPGESVLLGPNVSELEVVLYRPLHPNSSDPGLASSSPLPFAGRRTDRSASKDRRIIRGGSSHPSRQNISADHKPPAPLFFDTTACLFYNSSTHPDYVATGRNMTDIRGLVHKPHAILEDDGTLAGDCPTYNLVSVSRRNSGLALGPVSTQNTRTTSVYAVKDGVPMAAGDSVVVNFRRNNMCAGILVGATLFSKHASLCNEKNIYYMVCKPGTSIPLCLIPLTSPDPRYHSTIAVMFRSMRVCGEKRWELVNVSEPLEAQNVKTVVRDLQTRGLNDPVGYCSERLHLCDVLGEETLSARSDSCAVPLEEDEETDGEEYYGCGNDTPGHSVEVPFEDLLAHVPPISREGRRQYNVGRSTVNPLLCDESTSDDDNVLVDALRAVVPHYTNSGLMRYEKATYNTGSRMSTLASHYVSHRDDYGRCAAAIHTADGLPLLASRVRDPSDPASGLCITLNRCSNGGEYERPGLPPELLPAADSSRVPKLHRGLTFVLNRGARGSGVRGGHSGDGRTPSSSKRKGRRKGSARRGRGGKRRGAGSRSGSRSRSGQVRKSRSRSRSRTAMRTSQRSRTSSRVSKRSIRRKGRTTKSQQVVPAETA